LAALPRAEAPLIDNMGVNQIRRVFGSLWQRAEVSRNLVKHRETTQLPTTTWLWLRN
jgi:hypothetical protein